MEDPVMEDTEDDLSEPPAGEGPGAARFWKHREFAPVGILSVLIGVYCFAVLTGHLTADSDAPWFVFLSGGLLAVSGGLLILLRTVCVVIDPAAGRVSAWYGPFIPLRRVERSLARYRSVTLSGVADGDGVAYVASLTGGEGTEAVEIFDERSRESARFRAVKLARMAGLALVDMTEGAKDREAAPPGPAEMKRSA